jgi:hypothetical protein
MRPYSLHTCQLLNVLRQLLKHFFIQTFFSIQTFLIEVVSKPTDKNMQTTAKK